MKYRDDGFTLIETLIALAILSVSLVTFYGIGATSMRANSHLSKIEVALLLAHSKLDEIASRDEMLEAHTSGKFPGTDFHWDITANTTQPSQHTTYNLQSSTTIQDVHLAILWREGLIDQTISVDTRHLGVRAL
jgi:general secretion pathway protein I